MTAYAICGCASETHDGAAREQFERLVGRPEHPEA